MNIWIKRTFPSIVYILLCSIFLLLTLDYIPNNPFRIDLGLPAGIEYQYLHVFPVLLSFILIIPVLYVMLRPRQVDSWLNLHPLESSWELKKVFLVNLYFTFLICVFRTYILAVMTLPLEKLPMIYLIFIQIFVVEGCVLKDFGLHSDKFWQNTLLGSAYIFLMFFIILGPIILIALLLFFPQILVLLQQLAPYTTLPNPIFLASFVYQLLFVGISEELIFRGYFYNKLRRSIKSWRYSYLASIFISSVIFGLFHLPWYIKFYENTLIVSLPATFAVPNIIDALGRVAWTGFFGVLMCIIYEKTQSLVPTIIIHGLSNTIPAYLGSMFLPLLQINFWPILTNFINSLPLINLMVFIIIFIILVGPMIVGVFWLTPRIVRWCRAEAVATVS